jgi:hypothetical protein
MSNIETNNIEKQLLYEKIRNLPDDQINKLLIFLAGMQAEKNITKME